MEIRPFHPKYLSEAAALFTQRYAALRRSLPALPARMEDLQTVSGMIEGLFSTCSGLICLEQGQLAGYIGWYLVDNFRDTPRRGAYVPEWGHSFRDAATVRALYRAVSTQWRDSGCQTHAISLLAGEKEIEQTWFWQGFGLTVVDAIRPVQPIQCPAPAGITIRPATLQDIPALRAIDTEHWRHYTQPPILMAPHALEAPEQLAQLLQSPPAGIWLAEQDGALLGFMRFEPTSEGAAAIVQSPSTIAITGAYVRPQARGQRIAPALLDAALKTYQSHKTSCSVDFESLNPEASAFWLRYFEPVCFSLIRIPENA